MNHRLIQAWRVALLSGEYLQTDQPFLEIIEHGLTKNDPLGVLCRVAMKRGLSIPVVKSDSGDWFEFGKHAAYNVLPEEVQLVFWGEGHFMLEDHDGSDPPLDIPTPQKSDYISSLNCDGTSFKEFAKFIYMTWKEPLDFLADLDEAPWTDE